MASVPQEGESTALPPLQSACRLVLLTEHHHLTGLVWPVQVKDSTGSPLEAWQTADSTRDVQVSAHAPS